MYASCYTSHEVLKYQNYDKCVGDSSGLSPLFVGLLLRQTARRTFFLLRFNLMFPCSVFVQGKSEQNMAEISAMLIDNTNAVYNYIDSQKLESNV